MSDQINKNREKFVDQLIPLRKAKIYEKDEIQQIIQRWTKQEYTMKRYGSGYTEIHHAIEQEKIADKELYERTKHLDEAQKDKTIMNVFKKRIMDFYYKIILKYPRNLTYYVEYADYCKSIGFFNSAIRVYQLALKYFSRDIVVWNSMVEVILEKNEDIETGRKAMLLAVDINKKSEEGYLAYFKFELNYIRKLKKTIEVRFALKKEEEIEFVEDNIENNNNLNNNNNNNDKSKEKEKENENEIKTEEEIAGKKLQEAVNKLWAVLNTIYDNAIQQIERIGFKLQFLPLLDGEDMNDPNVIEFRNKVINEGFLEDVSVSNEKKLQILVDELGKWNKDEVIVLMNMKQFENVDKELKEKLMNQVNGIMEEEITPLTEAMKRILQFIQETKDKIEKQNEIIDLMKKEILGINRQYLNELKYNSLELVFNNFEEIQYEEDDENEIKIKQEEIKEIELNEDQLKERIEFIEWIMKTHVDEYTTLLIINYLKKIENNEMIKKIFDKALNQKDLQENSSNLWVEYLLFCREINDFRLSKTVRMKMNTLYYNPEEVELLFEQKVNETQQ